MTNLSYFADHQKSALGDNLGSARADLVNSGRDTQITLSDGSTIVLKGVTHIEAVLFGNSASWGTTAPIDGALSGVPD